VEYPGIPAPASSQYLFPFDTPATSTGAWYAVSADGGWEGKLGNEHNRDPSGITLSWVADASDGGGRGTVLYYFQPVRNNGYHIGGIHSVGKYLLIGVDTQSFESTRIEVMDLSNPSSIHWSATNPASRGIYTLHLGQFQAKRISSIAAAQLFDGTFAILFQERAIANVDHYYTLLKAPSMERIAEATLVSRQIVPTIGGDSLSMVTECETGRLFAVTATGPDSGSTNQWALLSIDGSGGSADVVFRGSSSYPTYSEDACQTRGGATAFSGKDRNLVLSCHEKSPGRAGTQPHRWDFEEWTMGGNLGVILQY